MRKICRLQETKAKKIVTGLPLAAVLLLFTQFSLGKDLNTVKPERVGMSSERLERLSQLNQRYVEQGKLAGVITMVAREGKVVHVNTAGNYSTEDTRPLTENTLFRIYSMTKPITAAGLMMLYEEGAFQLSDPVSKFLPKFAGVQVWTPDGLKPTAKPITMHHLLTHTAGLSYGFNPENPVDKLYREQRKRPAQNLDELIDQLVGLPLLYQPGEKWHYSMASDVLGAVIEKISALSLAEFLKRRMFDPLGMDSTTFSLDADQLDQLASNHRWDRDQSKLVPLLAGTPGNPKYSNVSLFMGGQGLVSTIGDYMKFAEMMRNGGEFNGTRYLSPKTIAFMTKNHLGATTAATGSGESPTINLSTAGRGSGFGLGFGVITDPVQRAVLISKGSYFWGGAAGTIFWIDPVENIVGIAMMQLMGSPWPFRQEMMTATYQSLTEVNE